MINLLGRQPMLDRITQWGQARDDVHTITLTSSLVNPNAHVDISSDYDIIVAVDDIQPYFDDRAWLEDFGRVLMLYKNPIGQTYGLGSFAYITQFEDGLKMDITLWPAATMREAVADPVLPEYLDIGYSVLLDKEGMTDALKPPTYRAHIPEPPAEADYLERIEEFYHEATYVAKHLW